VTSLNAAEARLRREVMVEVDFRLQRYLTIERYLEDARKLDAQFSAILLALARIEEKLRRNSHDNRRAQPQTQDPHDAGSNFRFALDDSPDGKCIEHLGGHGQPALAASGHP